ncbi:hypothetical protein [Methylobacter sp.]|uniref:hypothetical protein n=1 Tax=Methylobacter sp. TaxID=2051955 RepID=UPI0025F3EDE6|nr:hypothetical protein [Methylobacter sp.]
MTPSLCSLATTKSENLFTVYAKISENDDNSDVKKMLVQQNTPRADYSHAKGKRQDFR